MCKYLRKEKILPMKEAIEILKRGWEDVLSVDIAQNKIEFYQISKNGSSCQKYDIDLTDIYSVYFKNIFH